MLWLVFLILRPVGCDVSIMQCDRYRFNHGLRNDSASGVGGRNSRGGIKV